MLLTIKKILPLSIAVYGTIIILSCIVIFHLLVMAGIIPFNIVWGGNLTDKTELYTMEAISVALNVLMLLTILIYSRAVKLNINRKIITGTIWFMFGLFLFNTIGNLAAKNALETYIFTPLTLVLSVFCFRMAAFDPQEK